MKDIAIYRLQRVDKALERLNAAFARLEAAVDAKGAGPPSRSGSDDGKALADVQAELSALRQDYESLHGAASKVADRLDGTLDRLKAHAPAAVG